MLYFSIVVLYITILLIFNSFKKIIEGEGYNDKMILNTIDCFEVLIDV
jgi:hypothetical protein